VTVVFLHALPLDERMWERQRSQVTDCSLAPRLYGRGNTMDAWAEAVLESFSGPAVLVGASMGGYCAVAAARLAPERVAGVVLAGSRPDPDSPQRRAKRAETIAIARDRGAQGIWEAMRDLLFNEGTDPDLVARAKSMALDRTEDELVTALEAIRDRPDSTDAYHALGERRLTIVGDRDPFVSVEDARGFDPAAVVLPGCGHLPSLERPAEFHELVREAVARWT
jgi:pimeloyl-ACP methyl ester carboxylesterase